MADLTIVEVAGFVRQQHEVTSQVRKRWRVLSHAVAAPGHSVVKR